MKLLLLIIILGITSFTLFFTFIILFQVIRLRRIENRIGHSARIIGVTRSTKSANSGSPSYATAPGGGIKVASGGSPGVAVEEDNDEDYDTDEGENGSGGAAHAKNVNGGYYNHGSISGSASHSISGSASRSASGSASIHKNTS